VQNQAGLSAAETAKQTIVYLGSARSDAVVGSEDRLVIAAIARSLSVRELAKRWAVSPRKIRELLRRGILVGFDLGLAGVGRSQIRFTPEEVGRMESKTLAVRPATARKRRASIDPEIVALLE
jgi:hypothetical protein